MPTMTDSARYVHPDRVFRTHDALGFACDLRDDLTALGHVAATLSAIHARFDWLMSAELVEVPSECVETGCECWDATDATIADALNLCVVAA